MFDITGMMERTPSTKVVDVPGPRGAAGGREGTTLSPLAPRQLEPLGVLASTATAAAIKRRPTTLTLANTAAITSDSRASSPTSTHGGTPHGQQRRMNSFAALTPSPSTPTLTTPKRQSTVALRKRSSVLGPTPTRRSISPTDSRRRTFRGTLEQPHQQQAEEEITGGPENRDEDDDDDDGAESDKSDSGPGDDGDAINVFDSRHAERLYRATQATAVYADGGRLYPGLVDRRGITPWVTFTTTETPPSQLNNKLLADRTHQPTCGFCNSTNLIWVLRCGFCGCTRISDAPRLKYLIDMILSVDPTIKATELTKRILDFAKFDHVALKVEEKFKQASLVRAKAAIMMMSRTINILRKQMVRMMFQAWRGNNAIQSRHDAIMHRLIKIKDIQVKGKSKGLVFAMWRGYVVRIIEERSQRYSLASRRNDMTRLRRMWGCWQKFMRIRSKEKLQQLKAHYEAERNEAPNAFLTHIETLKEHLAESRRLVFAATNTMLELLHQTVSSADQDVLKTLQFREMYPSTVGQFFDAVHGQQLLDGLCSGHIASAEDLGMDDATAEQLLTESLEEARGKVERMQPHESLIQWLNFQRRRGVEMAKVAITSAANVPAGSAGASSGRPSLKFKAKDKKKDLKEIKGLQDLRASISSPGVMLKLLCHTSPDAHAEYKRIRATETAAVTANVTAENSTTSTALTPAAQVQLKAYFKMVARILNLPPDVITRDAFVLNDFDSLYAYAVYLYMFHPNHVAPGLTLTPRYHLNYSFFQPQWEKIQHKLTEAQFDPFAQQQYYIFLAKIKRINKQFLRFEEITKAAHQIAEWHQLATLRDTYNDFTRRVLGKDSNIAVALEKETLASWVSLPVNKLLSMCENENEFREIENVFKENVLDLIKIFRIYGSGSGGKGILEQEFLKVMTRAGVTDKKNILRSNLQIIYQQSRQPNVGGGSGQTPAPNQASGLGSPAGGFSNGPDGDDDGTNEDRGATPNEFFEALVRVAYHNFQKRREPGAFVHGVGSPSTSGVPGLGGAAPTLLLHVLDVVVEKVVPLTKKFQEQGLMFKKQMLHPDVQYVCKAQERKLKRLFLTYSQKNKNPSSRGKLMDLSDFEVLLKEKRLLDALFPHGRIKQLVAFVQQDGDMSAMGMSGFDSETEFVFAEFVEALAAIAVYRNANPYLPLAKKLETFFEETF